MKNGQKKQILKNISFINRNSWKIGTLKNSRQIFCKIFESVQNTKIQKLELTPVRRN